MHTTFLRLQRERMSWFSWLSAPCLTVTTMSAVFLHVRGDGRGGSPYFPATIKSLSATFPNHVYFRPYLCLREGKRK